MLKWQSNFYFNSASSPCDLILFKSSVIITLHETPHSDCRSGSPGTDLGPVYMEAGLARLARQPGKRDEFLLCLYEKISSRLPGQFCYIDVVLTVVKNSLRRYL